MKASINSVSWNRRIAVRFPAEARDLSLLPIVQTGSGAQSASCSVCTGGLFLREWSGPGGRLTTDLHLAPSLRISGAIFHFSICLHGVHKDNYTFTFINWKLNDMKLREWLLYIVRSNMHTGYSISNAVPRDRRLVSDWPHAHPFTTEAT